MEPSLSRHLASWSVAAAIAVAPLTAAAAPAAEPAEEAAAPAPPPTPGAKIHINVMRGDKDVVLRKQRGTEFGVGFGGWYAAERWETACVSPCDQRIITTNGEFALGGPGVPQTRKFSIGSDVEEVEIDVRPGRMGLLIGGLSLYIAGSVGAAVGGTLWTLDAIDRRDAREWEEEFGEDDYYERGPSYRPTVIAVTLVGTAVLAAGIAAIVASRTRYKLHKKRRR
ncbi:MAG: hypothetical protein AAF721_16600 [Myxococcota bacterium]